LRAIWAARDMPRPIALGLSPHFVAMADLDDWRTGQERFRTGERLDWTVR